MKRKFLVEVIADFDKKLPKKELVEHIKSGSEFTLSGAGTYNYTISTTGKIYGKNHKSL